MPDPLEAQGRGFSHGHKKTMGVPRTAEAKLRQMFEQDDGALRARRAFAMRCNDHVRFGDVAC